MSNRTGACGWATRCVCGGSRDTIRGFRPAAVRWLSGRKRAPRKRLYGKPYRGFKSLPHRQLSRLRLVRWRLGRSFGLRRASLEARQRHQIPPSPVRSLRSRRRHHLSPLPLQYACFARVGAHSPTALPARSLRSRRRHHLSPLPLGHACFARVGAPQPHCTTRGTLAALASIRHVPSFPTPRSLLWLVLLPLSSTGAGFDRCRQRAPHYRYTSTRIQCQKSTSLCRTS